MTLAKFTRILTPRCRHLLAVMLFAWITPALAASILIRDEALRASPSSTAQTVVKLAKGSQVDILTRKGGWVQVSAHGHKGWVRLLSVRSGGTSGGSLGDVVGLTQKRDNKVVAVAGLRGLDEENLKSAHYNAADMKRLDSYQTSAARAEQFAKQGGLASRSVHFLPAPQTQQPSASPWEGLQ